MSVLVTPDMKVGALLDAYPEVEEALIRAVPAFSKLRNPILRRTVAKVATLEQAASVAGMPARDLVLLLRQLTGQDAQEAQEHDHGCTGELGHGPMAGNDGPAPDWLQERNVTQQVDADEMLARGVHPIGRIRELCAGMGPKQIVMLRSSFKPEPLLATMRQAGFAVYYRDGCSYFCKI